MRGFRAGVREPRDGDTFRVMTDGGFDGRGEPWLRFYDTRAPELIMRLPRLLDPGGRETTAYVARWIAEAVEKSAHRRWYLSIGAVMTETFEPGEVTSFRRYLAVVWRHDDWPVPWATPAPLWDLSLNFAVNQYVIDHGWPPGE